MRKTSGGTRSGRKWLLHLAASVGIASRIAITSVRRLPATARTDDSKTRDSRIDSMKGPPWMSWANGKTKKSNASAIKSSTVEKRRLRNRRIAASRESFVCRVPFIPLHTFRSSKTVSRVTPSRPNECTSMRSSKGHFTKPVLSTGSRRLHPCLYPPQEIPSRERLKLLREFPR